MNHPQHNPHDTNNTTYPVTVSRRYPDAPLVGVAAVVLNREGEALLVKRGRPPGTGHWGLPGGLLNLGERLVAGVRREIDEECGIEIAVGDVINTFEVIERDEEGRIEYHYIVIDFWATHLSGKATAQDDAAAVAWVTLDDLDDYHLRAETHQVILEAFDAWQMHNGDELSTDADL